MHIILRTDLTRYMHIAVDLDNALELENRLDNGRGDEPKELAKGTSALWRHNTQAPILNEALADDNVQVMRRLSGFTLLLDANVAREGPLCPIRSWIMSLTFLF